MKSVPNIHVYNTYIEAIDLTVFYQIGVILLESFWKELSNGVSFIIGNPILTEI